jgi:heptosyltransferase-3
MAKRILLIRTDKIGDLILTLPMAIVIKKAIPGSHVSILVQEYTAPLVSLAPDIDETIIYDRNWSLRETILLIRSVKPDIIIVFGHKLKLTLASFIARIPIRIGRAYFWFSFLYNKKIYEHRKTAEYNEAEYNIRMLKSIGIQVQSTPLPILTPEILPKNTILFPEYIVLHLTTGGSAPHWDEKNFIELVAWITKEFSCPIILTGLPTDYEYLFTIAERMKHSSCNVHIRTNSSLLELISILNGAKIVVSGSTGPGHIAAALGIPTIGLFPGVVPLSKERWGFRGKQRLNLSPLTYPKADCPHCKNCTCINEITTSQVIEGIKELNII